MQTPITFGTSGWRGILGEDFTFDNVRAVIQAIAEHLHQEQLADQGVIVGYDPRFLGERFAAEAACVLAGNRVPVQLCTRDVPTPTIAYAILGRRLAGGVNITASHNSHEYNGLKFSPAWGGPALPETTRRIEERANQLRGRGSIKSIPLERARQQGLLHETDPCEDYLAGLEKLLDLEPMGRAGLRVVVDPVYGAGRGYVDTFLRRAGCQVTTLHTERDPYFGGQRPEPAEDVLQALSATVVREGAALGVATDGDADRFGIIDADGTFMQPNHVLALLLDYLIDTRGWSGGVARSVATTHLLDAVARKHGREVYETPVGFKFIGDLLHRGKIVLGGEESAGLSIQGHVPEKDGILACVLVAEMVARRGQTLRQMLDHLFHEVGPVYPRRDNFALTPALKARLIQRLESPPATLAGSPIRQVQRVDGAKFLLADGRWALIRLSGTEPVVRCYGEAASPEALDQLLRAVHALIFA